ncbi:MAG: hypothetical protein ABJU19_26835 [Roseobacter sp.]
MRPPLASLDGIGRGTTMRHACIYCNVTALGAGDVGHLYPGVFNEHFGGLFNDQIRAYETCHRDM